MSIVPWEIGARKKNTPMNKEAMKKNLHDFKTAMDNAGIPFIWTFGGLIGMVRDADLIEWDNDLDFACFSADHMKMKGVVEELEAKGFYVPDRNESPFGDHFFIRDGEKLEVWWYQKIGNEWIYDTNIRFPERFFNDLVTINYLDVDCLIPADAQAFLTHTYGEGWRVPNRNGSYIL